MQAISTELSTPAQHMPLPDLARQLAHDGLALARAEAVLAKTRVAPKVGVAKFALALIGAAAVLALLAAIGLIVGLVMALATLVGPGYAGLIVGVVGLATAGLMGLVGAHQLSDLLKPLLEKLG